MMTAEARLRFLYALNILVTSALAAFHLLAPGAAAGAIWGQRGLGGGTMVAGARPATARLPFQMLGAWWVAVAAVSALGLLGAPLKYRCAGPEGWLGCWACRVS